MRGEIVTRLRGVATVDPYSGEATGTDWSTPAELTIATLVPAEPRPSSEPTQEARNSVVSGWTLYLPSGSDVTSADRMRVRGIDYPVQGQPADWMGAGMAVQAFKTDG